MSFSRYVCALAAAVLLGAAPLVAQKPRPKRPTAAAPADTTARRTDTTATAKDSLTRFLESFSLRTLGPAAYSGRVTALAVPHTAGPAKTFYIGAAGGGVWKTSNGGITWQPVSKPSATSPSPAPIRTSCGWGPGRRTACARSGGATASTAPAMAARNGRTWG